MATRVILVDTNVILEAARTGIWKALTGAAHLETVAECERECLRGDRFAAGRITVEQEDLARLQAIHTVDEGHRAALILHIADVELDEGERDLLAHCLARTVPPEWVVASPDRAAIRAAVQLGWSDRLVSLEELAKDVGCHPARLRALRSHFGTSWLSSVKTAALLEG